MLEQARRYVIDLLCGELQRSGFILHQQYANGSRYLGRPGSPFKIRISGHQWSTRSHDDQIHVVSSWVVRPDVVAADVPELAVKVAMHFDKRVRERTRT